MNAKVRLRTIFARRDREIVPRVNLWATKASFLRSWPECLSHHCRDFPTAPLYSWGFLNRCQERTQLSATGTIACIGPRDPVTMHLYIAFRIWQDRGSIRLESCHCQIQSREIALIWPVIDSRKQILLYKDWQKIGKNMFARLRLNFMGLLFQPRWRRSFASSMSNVARRGNGYAI